MATETYMIPVKVVLTDAKNPDKLVVKMADAMYKTLSVLSEMATQPDAEVTFLNADHIDIEWSIYKKPDVKTFGKGENE